MGWILSQTEAKGVGVEIESSKASEKNKNTEKTM
jgi:hypothetical protein